MQKIVLCRINGITKGFIKRGDEVLEFNTEFKISEVLKNLK